MGAWAVSRCAAWTRLKVVTAVQIAGTMIRPPGNSASVDLPGLSPSSFVPFARP